MKKSVKFYIIFCFSLFLFGLFSLHSKVYAQTGSLYFDPATKSVSVGQNFSIKVMMNTGEDEVDSVVAHFTYPADKLQFVSISSSASVMDKQQRQEASSGIVYIERYTETFYTGVGEIATVTFKALASGTPKLEYTADSSLITGYDNPPDALATRSPATITVSALPATAIVNDFDFASFGFVFVIGLIFVLSGVTLFFSKKKENIFELKMLNEIR